MADNQEKPKKRNISQREVLYTWTSPQRHFKPLDKRRFMFVLLVIAAFMVILVLVGQYWLMAAIASVVFLVYAVGTVKPIRVKHTITNLGLETEEAVFEWEQLDSYWFSQRDGQVLLNIETRMRLPGRVIMLVNKKQMDKAHDILVDHLRYRIIRNQGRVSKMTDGEWVDAVGVGE